VACIILQKTSGKNEGHNTVIAVKNSYNLMGQFRRNTINILMSPTSLCKNSVEKIKRQAYACVHIASLKTFQ
jgi:hypothetical protein